MYFVFFFFFYQDAINTADLALQYLTPFINKEDAIKNQAASIAEIKVSSFAALNQPEEAEKVVMQLSSIQDTIVTNFPNLGQPSVSLTTNTYSTEQLSVGQVDNTTSDSLGSVHSDTNTIDNRDNETPTDETPTDETPVANDHSVSTTQNQQIDIQLNANDQDGDNLSFEISEPPLNGQLYQLR